jgi:predicted acetyltransferase
VAIEIRAVVPEELEAVLVADSQGFGQQPLPAEFSRSWADAELDRSRVAFEDGNVVGVSRAYSFQLALPGGATIPAAAVSWVSVLPTHRRRGVLTRMLDALHDDAREREEPAGILTASEGAIYSRFGYGVATWRTGLAAERSHIEFLDPAFNGSMRLVQIDEGRRLLPEIYDRIWPARAGMVTRPDYWWPGVFWDYQFSGGKKANFLAVHTDAHGVDDGWVAYEIRNTWTGGIPDGTLEAYDMQAATPEARADLWRYLFGIDLIKTVRGSNVPPDDPLRHMVTDPRRVRVDYVNDGLWIAPLDVPTVLASRSYTAPGRLVLDVHGSTFALEATDDKVRCEATSDAPDLACSTDVLGMAILGGNRWAELAGAGRVAVHNRAALTLADQMFATSPAPALMTGF